MEAALTEMRPKGAVKDWKMLCSQWRRIKPACFCSSRQHRGMIGAGSSVLDRVEKVDVLDDARCQELMARFIRAHPDLWNEDIGV